MLLGTTSFASPYWLTFNQIKTLGGRVKKVSKSDLVIFWKFFDQEQGEHEPGKVKLHCRLITAAKISGYEVLGLAQEKEAERVS